MAPARSGDARNEARHETDALRGVAIIDGTLSPKAPWSPVRRADRVTD